MNKSLAAILATSTAAFLCVGVHAQDTSSTAPLNQAEAHDQKTQAKADYKASKKEADARLDRAKADCEVSTNTSAEVSACKKDAKAQAKKDKADAKLTRAQDKASIDARTQ